MMQIAESTSPDSDTFNAEQTDDPYDNNIEAETTAYSKTVPIGDSPDLASPRDQEEKFVNLLKKQYKGTFPEYGKETKSDFSKNKELEDNLSTQPETVYFGHSDKYQGKNDYINDYPIPDEAAGGQDNLATFDEDANILNSLKSSSTTISPHVHSNAFDTDNFEDAITRRPSHRRQHKTQSIEDILSEYGDNTVDDGQSGIENPVTTEDYEGHKSVSENDDGNMNVNDKLGNENEHLTDHVTDHVTESMSDKVIDSTDDHVTDNANDEMEDRMSEHVTDHEASHMTDDIHDHVTDHMSDSMDDHPSEEKKLREKTEEEALWDSEEKLRQQLARKKKQKNLTKKKEKNLTNKKEKNLTKKKQKNLTKKKEKLKDDLSREILKDFDELKKHNNKTSEKPNRKIQENGKINQHKSEPSSPDKAEKHIKHVHADESQVSGDAILDFLDKLLEKDPKELKHDVLAMTKEMQNEGNPSSDSSEKSNTAQKAASNSDSSSKMEDKPQVTRESPQPNKAPDKVDNWVSQLENDMDVEKQDKGNQKEQKETSEQNEGTNEDYYDEEYDQFHDGAQGIDADHDGGQSVEHEENDQKEKEVKSNKDIKKKQDDFDYEEFKEEALKMHNEYRRRHNAVALTWSDSLAKKAHNLASKLLDATRTNFKRELEKQGENIAILSYSTKDIAKQAVEKWYTEITKFSFTSPSIKPETRDFTQIIWKNSKELGMGFVHTPDKKKTLVIALYSPTGNDEHKLRENLNTVHDDPYADIKRYFLSKP
ncbi:Hypothetical predicted protein [Paramuricea clavata]|nr:Hypothetical predicted protein [Paramuricea clavata]